MNFLTLVAQAAPKTVADSTFRDALEQKIQAISHMSVQDIINMVVKDTISIALKILVALAVFYIGRWLIRRVRKIMTRILVKRDVDVSLRGFLLSLVSITLMIFLIVIVVGIIGINTTSFIALFASAGLAIGMALSGTLQNFAGGVMILVFRPFRVGDFIEAQGQSGTVKEIQLTNTIINTPDNKTIMIPNGGISTGIVNNYSREAKRRVDWTFGIGYGDDYDKAKAVLLRLIKADSRIHADPEPFIALTSLGDSSVNIVVRVWVDSPDYWSVYFDMNEKVYKTFPAEGLNIPFPQMDVHLYQDK
ncbi:MAG: mechanosensitive ion channel [Rikenellaceae bacterium]|nr:mechanosensitive ion channel [Rikenellaceae bacterium]